MAGCDVVMYCGAFNRTDLDCIPKRVPLSTVGTSNHQETSIKEKKKTQTMEATRTKVVVAENDHNDINASKPQSPEVTEEIKNSSFSTIPFRIHASETKSRFQAFVRSLADIDYSSVQFISALRTAIIVILEWSILGIGNDTSATFQVACIFVGLSDPQGTFSTRLQFMGLTVLTTTLIGGLLPCLVWKSPAAVLISSFAVAFATGYAPTLGSPALFPAMKFGCVLFAVNCGINRNTDGYDDIGIATLFTFMGGMSYLLVASIPEIIGNREGMRAQFFRVWFGFGMNLKRWNSNWATPTFFSRAPAPNTTMSIAKTREIIDNDTTDDVIAKQWLSTVLERANTIRMACICLSNAYQLTEDCLNSTQRETVVLLDEDDVKEIFSAVGYACRRIGFALLFPWTTRYVPYFRNQLHHAEQLVATAAANLKKSPVSGLGWLPAIVDLQHSEVKSMIDTILEVKSWPPYVPIKFLPKRIALALPTIRIKPQDPDCIFRSYAFRFGIAFCLATLPALLIPEDSPAYWFPMTVALIMNPTESSTYQRVAHRSLGTLFGIGLGAAMYPLLDYPEVVITLLGCNAFASVSLFTANYAAFTCFITGWVFCVTVGVGTPLVDVVAYRCLWTLAAAVLVTVVTYLIPSRSKYEVTDRVIAMAKATKEYATRVVEHHQLMRESEMKVADPEAIQAAVDKVMETRQITTKARVEMLKSIHEASLAPTEGYLVEPHSMAPALAAYLSGAAVIPQLAFLVPGICHDDLLSDMDETTFEELDRLIRRLESHPGTIPAICYSDVGMVPVTGPGRGPFSHAIALAHRKLDEAKVPRDINGILHV